MTNKKFWAKFVTSIFLTFSGQRDFVHQVPVVLVVPVLPVVLVLPLIPVVAVVPVLNLVAPAASWLSSSRAPPQVAGAC